MEESETKDTRRRKWKKERSVTHTHTAKKRRGGREIEMNSKKEKKKGREKILAYIGNKREKERGGAAKG